MKLTQRTVGALALPDGKSEAIFFDDALPGFGLRLQGTSRRYVVQYKLGSKARRMTLGSAAALRLDDARASATRILARVRLGEDPAGEKAEARVRATDVFGTVVRRYLAHQKTRQRPGSYVRTEHSMLTHWKPLHGLQVARIDRRTIAAQLDILVAGHGQGAARNARARLSTFFTWAMGQGLAEANPVIGTNRIAVKDRDRVLSSAELASIWHAAGDGAYGTILKLLILTGQRREEIGGLRWSEIDFAGRMIRLPPERVKNGQAHDVPLAEQALALLREAPRRLTGDFVFGTDSGFGNFGAHKRALDARIDEARDAPMKPWVIHDLRRTCATGMIALGVQPHVVEATINHTGGHRAGVAGIYNRHTYEAEKRVALDRWAAHIMGLVEGAPAQQLAG
jgi:integrase